MTRRHWVSWTLGACLALAARPEGEPRLRAQAAPQRDDVINMEIFYEASNHIEIRVAYRYSGSHGDVVWAAPALLARDGRRTGATRPGTVVPGTGATWMRLFFDAPPYGERPSGANQVEIRMSMAGATLAQRVFDWSSSYSRQQGPRLLAAVTSAEVEETRGGRRPAPYWSDSFFSRGGSQPQVCRFLVFEDLTPRNQVLLVARRNGRPAGEQGRFVTAAEADKSYATYDATTSVYFCDRRAQGEWEESILLNGFRVGGLKYWVDVDIHTDRPPRPEP